MLATMASITSANRIKRCGDEYGVNFSVTQTPHALTKEGCGYSIRFDESNKKYIEECAKRLNIKIHAFFKEIKKNNSISYLKE